MDERKYCVYKHTSPSGKVYIGITRQKSVNHRWKNGLGYQSSPHFWNAIQKYGWEHFTHEILFENLSEDEACEKERQLIEQYKSIDNQYGYNCKTGGEKGSSLNIIARQQLSEKRRQFYRDHPEEKMVLSQKIKGFHHTNESKRKMSEAAKNRHYVLTDEWKTNIGKANKTRLESDSTLYEETCNRCRTNGQKNAKPVEQLDAFENVIASFSSAHEAERITGIKNGNISSCCRGSKKSAGGYKWRYAVEYNSSRETA